MRNSLRDRLQRTALVAVLALVSHALLPYLHALEIGCSAGHSVCASAEDSSQPAHSDGGPTSSHPDDCPVCSAIAHGGARAVEAPSALPVHVTYLWVAATRRAPVLAAPSADVDVACARAPPAPARSA